MNRKRKLFMGGLAIILMASVLGVGVQPAEAASCAFYHIVSRGQSLSGIGAYYGVAWKYLAEINGISSPYTIYPGEQICIPSGATRAAPPATPYYPEYGYSTGYSSNSTAWNFNVVGVVQGKTVTIRTYNFPDNVWFNVEIGCLSCGSDLVQLADLDTDVGGTFNKVFEIPDEFADYGQLVIRLTQPKKGISVERVFRNVTFYSK